MISTKILADSVNPNGVRITSFLVEYHRMVHAELLTHRAFSRNSSSSRAIPVLKAIERISRDPAMPVYWGKNKPGMSAEQELTAEQINEAKQIWNTAAQEACKRSYELAKLGVHKQIANRPAEPFSKIQVVITTRYVNNFFGRRAAGAAQPEFQLLAYSMLGNYIQSTPKSVPWGGWHLPFDGFGDPTYQCISDDELEKAKVVSVRCARTSYLNFDGTCDLEKDMELYEQLVNDRHPSPFEHACRADEWAVASNFGVSSGWQQYRKMLPNEDGEAEDLNKIWDERPDWIKKLLDNMWSSPK